MDRSFVERLGNEGAISELDLGTFFASKVQTQSFSETERCLLSNVRVTFNHVLLSSIHLTKSISKRHERDDDSYLKKKKKKKKK